MYKWVNIGTASILQYIVGGGDPSGWHAWLVLGIPLGAGLAAKVAGEYRFSASGPKELLRSLCGGLLMGVGAVTCLGDDIASGLTGTAFFSLTGITATVFMLTGAYVTNLLMERKEQ